MQSQWTVSTDMCILPVLRRDSAAFKLHKKYSQECHRYGLHTSHALKFSLSFLSSLSVRPSIHPGSRKWPGSVEGAEHDRTPALAPHWCHTHYGPFINNLVPLSLMSFHH